MMLDVLRAIALAASFLFGAFFGSLAYGKYKVAQRKKLAREALGDGSALNAVSVSLDSSGLSAWIIERAVLFSLQGDRVSPFLEKLCSHDFERSRILIEKSGLAQVLSKEGYAGTRMYFSFGGMLAGALLGAVFSTLLCTICAAAGFLLGWRSLLWALKEESHSRAFSAERQFSQMVEVVVLGLKSGMSFDKALTLYCDSFGGSLSAAISSAHGQWSHSLIERSEGLRQIARSYDSLLFDRFAENVIRSLRFGTSMAENLSLLAVEARAIRKAKLEEHVAKAPVKMLLPVGTLILPAMLILVMGPIMLDLMKGF